MARGKSKAQKAKNDKEFFERLARKNNPIRHRMALPADVNLEDVDWNPDFAERGFSRLREIDEKFAATEREYRELRIRIAMRMIEEDRKRLKEFA